MLQFICIRTYNNYFDKNEATRRSVYNYGPYNIVKTYHKKVDYIV